MYKTFKLLIINVSVFILFFTISTVVYEFFSRENENDSLLKVDKELGWDSINEIEVIGNLFTKREITFIGDSFTQNALWTHETILQLNLHNYPTSGYSEGVSGYGTIQSLQKLKKRIYQHKPKFVVLLFYAWNDIRDNLNTPGIYYSPEMQKRPYYVNENSFDLIRPQFKDSWITNLAVYKELFFKIKSYIQGTIVEKIGVNYYAENRISLNVNYGKPISWEPFYQEHMLDSSYVNLAWKKTYHALQELKYIVDKSNSELLIIGIDNAFTVDDDVYDLWAKNIQNFNPNLPLNVLEKKCNKLGINFYNAVPDLQNLKEITKNKIYEGPLGNLSGHLKQDGEKLIGEIVAKLIKSKL